MVVMASARDLISIFVALELLSIPAYLLAGWRKRDLQEQRGVAEVLPARRARLGRDALRHVADLRRHRHHPAHRHRHGSSAAAGPIPIVTVGIFFVVVGFAFKVSAVPFHFWAPDTYEGAPTPVTAFLSVASKTAGFVALLELVYVGFFGQSDVWQPLFWVLAALTMTVGNLIALRQTNIVRMLAYSSIAQAGYILVPFAVAGDQPKARHTRQTASRSSTC